MTYEQYLKIPDRMKIQPVNCNPTHNQCAQYQIQSGKNRAWR